MYRRPFSTATTPNPEIAAPLIDDAADGRRADSNRRRALLVAGSALLAAVPVLLLEPAAHWSSDPGLFQLLRGMGMIKAALAAFALAMVWWRLNRTTSTRLAATYIGGVWVLALAAGLIWELTAVMTASALFHGATIALLLAAWRDSGPLLTR